MRHSDVAELEPRVRASLAAVAAATPVEHRWNDLAARLEATEVAHDAGEWLRIVGASGSTGAEHGDHAVELAARRRRPLFVAAVAAAVVLLVGGLAGLDRLRHDTDRRPNAPGPAPHEPAHLLPAGDLRTMRVRPTGALASRMFFAADGSRLLWAVTAGRPPLATDARDSDLLEIAGSVVYVDRAPAGQTGDPPIPAARWERGDLRYLVQVVPRGGPNGGAAVPSSIDLRAILPELVPATADAPPGPPAGLFQLPLLDDIFTGVSVEPASDEISEFVLWPSSAPDPTLRLEAFAATLNEHAEALRQRARLIDVGGRPGVYVEQDDSGPTIVFSPVDGTIGLITSGTGAATQADLVRIALGLHPVDDDTWSYARYGGRLAARGTSGAPWSIAVPDGAMCVHVEPLTPLSIGSCHALVEGGIEAFELQSADLLVIAPAETTTLRAWVVAGGAGPIDTGTPTTVAVAGHRWTVWVFAVTSDMRRVAITAEDTFGATLATDEGVTLSGDPTS